MTAATLIHLRGLMGATQQDIADQLGMGLTFVQKVEDGRRALTKGIIAVYTDAAIRHMQKVPVPLQWDEDQATENPEKEPIPMNVTDTIPETINAAAVPTLEGGHLECEHITRPCPDHACFSSEHVYERGEGYFHRAYLETSPVGGFLDEPTWTITVERLDSNPAWAICSQVQDDLTADDTLAAAAAMTRAAHLAGRLNAGSN